MQMSKIRTLTEQVRCATGEVKFSAFRRTSRVKMFTEQLRTATSEANMNAASLKFLEKMSKGSKGAVNISLLKEAFQAMKGWSVQETQMVIHLNGSSDLRSLKKFLSQWVAEGKRKGLLKSFHDSLSKKDPYTLVFKEGVTPEEIEKYVRSITRHVKVVSSAPRKGVGKVGDIYISKPSDPYKYMRAFPELAVKIDNAWAVVPAWTFKASNGAEKTIPYPAEISGRLQDGHQLKLSRFWTWAYKNGLREDAASALEAMDQEEVALKTAPKSKRPLIRRDQSEEVRKVLNRMVQKKYNQVVSALNKAAVDALEQFMSAHDEHFQSEREKGNEYPRFFPYKYFEDRPSLAPYKRAILEAVEQKNKVSDEIQRKSNWKSIIKSWAVSTAKRAKETFVEKNEQKLGRIVNSKGNLKKAKILSLAPGFFDYGGEIKFEFEDGSSFIVRNKTVWKTSPLGNSFVQTPTTFHDVVFPDGSKMTGSASEKRMLEVFAGVSAT